MPVNTLQDLSGVSWGFVASAEAPFEIQKHLLYGGTEISLVQSTPVSVRDLQCCLNSYHLTESFHLLRKSDWHALLPFHFFSSRGEVCYMIHHKNAGKKIMKYSLLCVISGLFVQLWKTF